MHTCRIDFYDLGLISNSENEYLMVEDGSFLQCWGRPTYALDNQQYFNYSLSK